MAADVTDFLSMMPPLEKGDPRITAVPWDDGMTKACAGVLENPKENVLGIIAKFGDNDDGKDYRARYLLRGVVTVAAGPDQKGKLEPVVEAIASQLSSDRAKQVKAALIRELRFAATPSAAKAVAPFLTDEELCADAANAVRSMHEGATALLLAALPAATGICRTEIMHALAALAEPAALPALQAGLSEKELDTRLEACWGVGRQGDATSADALLKMSAAAAGWERIQTTNALLLLAENLQAAGKKAEAAKIYGNLKETRTEKEETYVRELATKALGA